MSILNEISERFPRREREETGALKLFSENELISFSNDISEIAVFMLYRIYLTLSERSYEKSLSIAEEIRNIAHTETSVMTPMDSITLFFKFPEETKIFLFRTNTGCPDVE